MTTFFTADLHLGHANLVDHLSPRRQAAFGTVERMDEALLERWNDVVRPEDTVWVLGDLDMHGKPANLAKVAGLHGTKLLVAGNHDACWAGVRDSWRHRETYLAAGFAAVLDFARTTLPAVQPDRPRPRVLLSHFPYDGDHTDEDRFEQFRLRDHGVPLLHGHVHEAYRERRSALGTWGINVGVDVWDWAPVSEHVLAAHLAGLQGSD
jgi:calcineurin-like phosphoesterase family protein